jgi:tRNA(Ile)-lysidine synthase
MKLLQKVQETIKKYSMLSKGDSVLIGLSGGPDSVCLTVILDKLKGNFNLSLHAVYVDHGLRPEEGKKEQAFCRTICEKLGIGFCSKSVDVKGYAKEKRLNIQEAARELRYQIFEEVSKEINATKIALAHNADDQAETVLMRLLRGSGSKGLSGIPPVRGKIIRPLIEIERREIEKFLSQNLSIIPQTSPPFIIDSSNLKTDYLRNWIRLKVMPELKRHNPALVYSIGRSAEILRDEDVYLESIVTKTLEGLISKKANNLIELSLFPLENMEKPILRRLLRRAIKEIRGTERGIDFVHIEDIINLIKNGKSGDSLNLLNGIRAIKGYSTLLLTSEAPLKLKTCVLNVPGELFLEENGIILKTEISENMEDVIAGKDTAVFDYDSLTFPLIVRMREQGDYFYPSGFGKRKKLQDFFVDNKVPKDKRDVVPIVVSGKDIIWVAGYRMDERFRAKKDTKRFLIIRKMSI